MFEREGYDVHCELPLTFAQMALGAEVQVPTLDGNVPYTVREGTQPGETFRLKGKGSLTSTDGDAATRWSG